MGGKISKIVPLGRHCDNMTIVSSFATFYHFRDVATLLAGHMATTTTTTISDSNDPKHNRLYSIASVNAKVRGTTRGAIKQNIRTLSSLQGTQEVTINCRRCTARRDVKILSTSSCKSRVWTKSQREISLFLELPEFPYNTSMMPPCQKSAQSIEPF